MDFFTSTRCFRGVYHFITWGKWGVKKVEAQNHGYFSCYSTPCVPTDVVDVTAACPNILSFSFPTHLSVLTTKLWSKRRTNSAFNVDLFSTVFDSLLGSLRRLVNTLHMGSFPFALLGVKHQSMTFLPQSAPPKVFFPFSTECVHMHISVTVRGQRCPIRSLIKSLGV